MLIEYFVIIFPETVILELWSYSTMVLYKCIIVLLSLSG